MTNKEKSFFKKWKGQVNEIRGTAQRKIDSKSWEVSLINHWWN